MCKSVDFFKKNQLIFFFLNDRIEELHTNLIPRHQYVPVHGMQWVWLIMVAALVVPHVDGYRCVEGGEEMMATCAEQTESETETPVPVFAGDLFAINYLIII